MTTHTRSRTGCFTCRKAGYKCDEQKPQCGRCIRLRLNCEGYGIKYKWKSIVTTSTQETRQNTKRRRSIDQTSVSSPISIASFSSVPATLGNASSACSQDFNKSMDLASITPQSVTDLSPTDRQLMHHWVEHLSALISVTPRSLQSSPFQVHLTSMIQNVGALRSTILSMAANHLALVSNDSSLRLSAFRHQRDAIHLLQQLIQDPVQAGSEPALASVLMMQVSARLFGEEDEGSHVANHLMGAKAMIARRGGPAKWISSSSAKFLLSLFAYHDILSSVSRGSRPLVDHNSAFTSIEGVMSMESIARVLQAVARISELQHTIKADGMSEQNFTVGSEIQQELLAMTFEPAPKDCTDSSDIVITAEAYRQAAFIYLYRVWLGTGAPSPITLDHVQQCICSIEQIRIDSPLTSSHIWPLFTAGCEAVDSMQRQLVRGRLQAMYELRRFPSLRRVMRDIEDVWSAKDAEQLMSGLDGMSKIDCIKVIQRQGREVDLA